MKKSLFPIVFLVMAFVVILMADDTLFEGIFMTERLLMTNNVNGAYAILQTGTVLDPSCSSLILGGTNGIGRTELEACNIAGIDRTILRAGASGSIILDYQTGALKLGNSGSEDVTVGATAKNLILPSLNVFTGAGANWGNGDLVWSGVGGTLSNLGNFTSVMTITASNFVQSTGSMGGYVGNGSGLTNLPGSGVGGFTSGSVIFAGTTGALSQNNPRFFWDNTNFALNINTNVTPAGVALEVNGGALQVEGPAIITSSGPITNIIGSVSGLIPSVYITNVSADFPSTLTLAGSDLSFTIPATILTNSVVVIGRPPTETTGLVTVGLMTNNGIVVIRARNVTAGTIDQAALPYRIQVTVNPTQ